MYGMGLARWDRIIGWGEVKNFYIFSVKEILDSARPPSPFWIFSEKKQTFFMPPLLRHLFEVVMMMQVIFRLNTQVIDLRRLNCVR